MDKKGGCNPFITIEENGKVMDFVGAYGIGTPIAILCGFYLTQSGPVLLQVNTSVLPKEKSLKITSG